MIAGLLFSHQHYSNLYSFTTMWAKFQAPSGHEILFLVFIRLFFPRFPRFFPTLGKNEGFLGGKRDDFSFSLHFNSLFLLLLIFSQEMPDFSQNCGFSGKLWENDCFAFFSAVLLHRRRNKTTPKWFGALETSSYII